MARRIIAIAVVALVCSGAALSDSLKSVMGWPYGEWDQGLNYAEPESNAQGLPIEGRIAYLVYPVLGLPALAEPGGSVNVIVSYPEVESLLDESAWQVDLLTRFTDIYTGEVIGDPVGQRYPLLVEEVTYDGLWQKYFVECKVPASVPQDTYALFVATDDFADVQPASVGVRESADSFDFVHICDTHFNDPRGRSGFDYNSQNYPFYQQEDKPTGILAQELYELGLLDIDMAIITGDLVYGMEPHYEFEDLYRMLRSSGVPVFAHPGNHDGYSTYMFSDELYFDGLNFFKEFYGPLYYSFDWGPLHFVCLNSYDGTVDRRDSLPLPPIASPVDNWGGFLSDRQLFWLEADLSAAAEDGKTSFVFAHHDPRGPFTPNEPFPTSPFGLDGHEEWNIDSAEWDSDPTDSISDETPSQNTGIHTMELFNDYLVAAVFMGHVHWDHLEQFNGGEQILNYDGEPTGIIADHAMQFVHTTTAGSSTHTDNDYWGYRLVEVEDGQISRLSFVEGVADSLPAGNLWVEGSTGDGNTAELGVDVVSALPDGVKTRLKFFLPSSYRGYLAVDGEGNPLEIYDVGLGDELKTILYVKADVPAGCEPGAFPPPAGQELRFPVYVVADLGNVGPNAAFVAEKFPHDACSFSFDGTDSNDPDGHIEVYFWAFGDGESAFGPRVDHRFTKGEKVITLTVLDDHGAMSQAAVPIDACRLGDEFVCGCSIGTEDGGVDLSALIAALLGLGLIWYRRGMRG